MVKKSAARLDEHDLTLEIAPLPVTESSSSSSSSTSALPVVEAEASLEPKAEVETEAVAVVVAEDTVEDSSEEDKARSDVKTFEQRIAELEDNFVKLQSELYTLINKKKKKNKKGRKGNKDKVKCKCKDKAVDIAECKSISKKLDK